MQHRKTAAGAVVMHHQIVHSQNARIAAHGILDLLHKFRARRFAQQRAERIPHHADAAIQNKHCHSQPHKAIHARNTGKLCYKQRNQHCCRRDHIIAAVGRRCHQHLRIDHSADLAVEGCHPKLYQNRNRQHGGAEPAEHGRLRVQHLAKAFFAQLYADHQDHHRYRQRRNIFIACMAIGMLHIGRGAAQLKAHQADHIAAGIRKVVQPIGQNGNAAKHGPRRQLTGAQQYVTHDAHHAGQVAVS